MYPFIFWGTRIREDNYESEKFSGCTFADTYAEAMTAIEAYYGDELADIHLEALEEDNVIEFSNPKEGKKIVKRENMRAVHSFDAFRSGSSLL